MEFKTINIATAIENFMKSQEYDGFAINCHTKEEAEQFLRALHSLGRYWSESQPIVNDEGEVSLRYKYKDKTCYRFFLQDRKVYNAQRSFYENKNFVVLDYEDMISEYALQEEIEEIEEIGEIIEPEEVAEEVAEEPVKIPEVTEDFKDTEATSPIDRVDEPVEIKLTDKNEVKSKESYDEKDDKNNTTNTKISRPPVRRSVRPDNESIPKVCKLLGLEVKQPFLVDCDDILLFLPNTYYRFNENGTREYQISLKKEFWVACNDERELSYLINHPEIILEQGNWEK